MEQFAAVNGIDICYEVFGDPADPAVLAIMGSGTPGVRGEVDDMVRQFTSAGLRLVRYDARDTGHSTQIDFETNPYNFEDMAADAVGLLDALDIEAAHLFGGSLGGMVAQEIAIGYPERVLSLTSFMSTPAVHTPGLEWSGGLSATEPKVLAAFEAMGAKPPTTLDERTDGVVGLGRVLAGSRYPFDEEAERPLIRARLARAIGEPNGNHGTAGSRSRDRVALLGNVRVPTLVVHGTEDPIIPYDHGVATAKAIPGARLWTVEGLGHELPPAFAQEFWTALIDFVKGVEKGR
jgi:pimeloyl-ACP methyl ester carboxylesterase